jgi:hypothetical protein
MRIGLGIVVIAFTVASVTAAQNLPGTMAKAGGQTAPISVEGGRLSVRLHNASVRQTLEELGRRLPVKIMIANEADDSEISAEMNGVTFDLGLRTLLVNYDTFFYYGAPGQEPSSLRGVWVFPKGAALTMQPASLQACAGGKELEAVLADADPRVRQQGYEALLMRPDSRSRDLVIQAIRGARERDEQVRQLIFSAALSRGFDIPPEVLWEMARADVSEQVRWLALDALAQHPNAQRAAQAALSDTSVAVRQKAQEILTALGAESQRQQGYSRPAEQQP